MYICKLSLEEKQNDGVIVFLDKYARMMNGVEVIPVEQFLKALWNSEII
jgi:hypothetical protein